MGAGSEPQDQNAGASVSKARNWAGPVDLILIGASPGVADSAAVIAQTRTALTLDDGIVDLLQNGRQGLHFRTGHYIP
jgi:hypothetical protein